MADKDTPADNADDQVVDAKDEVAKTDEDVKEVEDTEEAEDKAELPPEALDALSEGVKGEVTENDDISQPDVEEGAGEAGDDAGDKGDTTDEGQVLEDAKPATGTEEKQVTNPGDFQPGDYAFDITTTDGKTVKISTPEDADAFAARLDDEEGLISAAQFLQFNRKSAIMDIGINNDRANYDKDKETFEAEQQLDVVRDETMKQWGNEIDYLTERGELPKLSDSLSKADWTDPEVAKQPGVAERVALLAWMDSENNRRIDAGIEPMRSMLDAHNAMQLEAMRSDQKKTAEADRVARQRRGSMVGSPAASEPIAKTSKGVVGLGGTLDDLVVDFTSG